MSLCFFSLAALINQKDNKNCKTDFTLDIPTYRCHSSLQLKSNFYHIFTSDQEFQLSFSTKTFLISKLSYGICFHAVCYLSPVIISLCITKPRVYPEQSQNRSSNTCNQFPLWGLLAYLLVLYAAVQKVGNVAFHLISPSPPNSDKN